MLSKEPPNLQFGMPRIGAPNRISVSRAGILLYKKTKGRVLFVLFGVTRMVRDERGLDAMSVSLNPHALYRGKDVPEDIVAC
jgi:hypothetical protein